MKKWTLRAPIECRNDEGLLGLIFGKFRNLCQNEDFSVILNPGDVIVLNTNWWEHSTKVVGDKVSITLTKEFHEKTPIFD